MSFLSPLPSAYELVEKDVHVYGARIASGEANTIKVFRASLERFANKLRQLDQQVEPIEDLWDALAKNDYSKTQYASRHGAIILLARRIKQLMDGHPFLKHREPGLRRILGPHFILMPALESCELIATGAALRHSDNAIPPSSIADAQRTFRALRGIILHLFEKLADIDYVLRRVLEESTRIIEYRSGLERSLTDIFSYLEQKPQIVLS